MELYKQLEATFNNSKLKVSISNDNLIMAIMSTVYTRPKNRRQKKFLKKKASEFKKVEKGLYAVTLTCRLNAEVFAKLMSLICKDENGNIGFHLEEEK